MLYGERRDRRLSSIFLLLETSEFRPNSRMGLFTIPPLDMFLKNKIHYIEIKNIKKI